MSVTLLKDILLSRQRIEDYFEGTVPTTLWRAFNPKLQAHAMDLFERDVVLPNGKPRRADVKIEKVNGEDWIFAKNYPGGASTFDRPNFFRGKSWEYFRIPAGTKLPEGLAVVRDEYNVYIGATHHTLAPAWDMPLKEFKLLLKILFSDMKKDVG